MPLLERAVESHAADLGAQLDPLSLLRIGVALDWLERSHDAFRDAARDDRPRRASRARWAYFPTCSSSTPGTGFARAC